MSLMSIYTEREEREVSDITGILQLLPSTSECKSENEIESNAEHKIESKGKDESKSKAESENQSNHINENTEMDCQFPSTSVYNAQLLEAVLVTAISLRESSVRENTVTATDTATSYASNQFSSFKMENVPAPKNVPGVTPKTTSRVAKITAAAERLSALQHTLLILLYLKCGTRKVERFGGG